VVNRPGYCLKMVTALSLSRHALVAEKLPLHEAELVIPAWQTRYYESRQMLLRRQFTKPDSSDLRERVDAAVDRYDGSRWQITRCLRVTSSSLLARVSRYSLDPRRTRAVVPDVFSRLVIPLSTVRA
jgi:hypothetical protein